MKRGVILWIIALLYGGFFGIKWPGMIVLLIGTAVAGIFSESMARKQEIGRQDFFQLTEYMQGMGMSYLLSGTEYAALKECVMLFEDSKIRRVLWQAQQYMEQNHDGKGSEGAFKLIEGEYTCKKLKLLHNYILTASKVGGEFRGGIRLLLRDQELWKKQQMLAYEDIKADKRKVYVAILLTILLCGYVSRLAAGQVDITQGTVYQIGMILFWFGCIFVYLLCEVNGKMDWFEESQEYSQNEIKDKMSRYQKITKRRGIGYRLLESTLRKELIIAFPEWMLEVALRMESKNVAVALEESYDGAPVIVRYYLEKMLSALKEHPEEGEAYFQFASELHVPEVTNSMKLLYGISKGVVVGGEEQIKELIERNYQLESQSRAYRMEKKRSILYGCSLLPSLLGAGGMILNMSLLLIGFLQNLKI